MPTGGFLDSVLAEDAASCGWKLIEEREFEKENGPQADDVKETQFDAK